MIIVFYFNYRAQKNIFLSRRRLPSDSYSTFWSINIQYWKNFSENTSQWYLQKKSPEITWEDKKEEICKKRQKRKDQSERVGKKAKTCSKHMQIHVNSLFLLHWRGPYFFQKGGGGTNRVNPGSKCGLLPFQIIKA